MLLIRAAIPTKPMLSTNIAASDSISVKPCCRRGLWPDSLCRDLLRCDIDISIIGYRHRFTGGTVRQCEGRGAGRGLDISAWLELQRHVLVQAHRRRAKWNRATDIAESRRTGTSRSRSFARDLEGICRAVERYVVRTAIENRPIASGLYRPGNAGHCGANSEILHARPHRRHRHCRQD